MSVVHMAELRGDNRLITPAAMLRAVADDIEAGKRRCCHSAVVILVDDRPEPNGESKFWMGWSMANMRASVALVAVECFKQDMLQQMGYAAPMERD
jgi:hypothetical protein